MKANIFASTPHWKQTAADLIAESKFQALATQMQKSLPPNFYSCPLLHLSKLQQSSLYTLLKNIPKGVMHHNHYFCNDDSDFYEKYIISDSRIYLTADLRNIQISTKEVAKENGWISMKEGQEKYGKEQWLKIIVDLTSFTHQQIDATQKQQSNSWQIFESKVSAPKNIIMVRDIFQKYSRHIFLKYIKNGYDRIQIRCKTERLVQYDSEGNVVKQYEPLVEFMNSLNNVTAQICVQYPNFSYGLIFGGLKMFEDHKNYEIFKLACESNWDRVIGFDFVQQEDKYDSLERYDKIVDQILYDFPKLSHLKKVYHAGQTNNHLSNNIDIAIRAGTVRIGHGLNILQRIDSLPYCKNICFQKNPVSNILLGYADDAREASAPILLGLGYPVSISPDGPGKFGLKDSTIDYLIAVLSYNWSLKHLKLIGYHSINHAICEEKTKTSLIKSFEASWNQWVGSFLEIKLDNNNLKSLYDGQNIFSICHNYSFSPQQNQANVEFQNIIDSVSEKIPDSVFNKSFIDFKEQIRATSLFALLKSMPKGCLHCCHFLTGYDKQFFLNCIEDNQELFVSRNIISNYIGDIEECSLISLKRLRQVQKDQDKLVSLLYSLVSFSKEQFHEIYGNQQLFWRLYHQKISIFISWVRSASLFRKYTNYIFRKYAKLNYLRVQFRLEPILLVEYSEGNIAKTLNYSEMVKIIDEEYSQIKKQFANFTIGFILLGNKRSSKQQNKNIFEYFCRLNWLLLVGFDFEQDIEDSCQTIVYYNQILDEVIIEFENNQIRKIYQAGNSCNHMNTNISQALQSNSFRISNGLNILQHTDLLARCKNTCFELNPILNLVEGASKRSDLRLSIAPIILGLGFPVSINSDHAGTMGLEDTIYDIFMGLLSFNWSLRHLKLTIVHSINHSGTTQGNKLKMLKMFQNSWKQWLTTVK